MGRRAQPPWSRATSTGRQRRPDPGTPARDEPRSLGVNRTRGRFKVRAFVSICGQVLDCALSFGDWREICRDNNVSQWSRVADLRSHGQ